MVKKGKLDNKEIFRCEYCIKEFKRLSAKNNHQIKQLCRPEKDRTYCEVCDIICNTSAELKQHYISKKHLETVIGEELEEVIIVHKKYDVDPYLTNDEIKQITTCDEGSNFKLNFTNNTSGKITSTASNNQTLYLQPTNIIEIQTKIDKEDDAAKLNYQKVIMTEIEGIPLPTDRQERILKYLSHFQNDDIKIMETKLRELLPLFTIDDIEYLNTHIRESSILSLESKQIYCNYLNKVVNLFTISYNKGIKEYHGICIIEFISKLMK